jgi:methyltransferase (TIGR00027 family)
MSESIEHVSDTAFWVAYYRWLETKRKDALFHDPLAKVLVGNRGARLARHMGIVRAMQWSMSIRTWIIDRYIAEAVADGIDMVVNLGAGLDTRPYRLDLPHSLQWVEVDFEHVIDYKADKLKEHAPVCHLLRMACNLADEAERRALLDRLNASASRILVLTEGVIPYLSNPAVASLADALAAEPHIAYWLTDYFSPLFKKVGGRGGIQKRLAKNAPFLFYPGDDPLDWPRFFAHNGWEVAEMRYTGEEGIKIGRDLPAPFIMRFLMRFAPEDRLRPYRRMNGYALLRKGNAVVDIA